MSKVSKKSIGNSSGITLREFYCGPLTKECCRLDVLTSEERIAFAKHAYFKVISKTKNLFFWGNPLSTIIRSNFFENLSSLLYSSFGKDDFTIEIFNTLIMFTLYQEPTSRIVQVEGHMDGQPYQTDWVEFQHKEIWYAVGLGSFNKEMDGQLFRACDLAATVLRECRVQKMTVIEHEAFWESTAVARLNYLMRDAETSNFWFELCYSNWSDDEMLELFNLLEDCAEAGKSPNYIIVTQDLAGPALEISQATISALMR